MSDKLRITLPQQLVEVNAEDIAVAIASASNEEQADFWNRFAQCVKDNYEAGCVDLQMPYVTPLLTSDARSMLMTMGEYSKDFR